MKTCEFILQHLLPPVRRACLLVPELTLSILTSSHSLWHIPYEEAMAKLDRSDPWWVFLWPGSQALSRLAFRLYFSAKLLIVSNSYLLDNGSFVRERRVLDVGCGCGASAIAAKLAGAINVIANDIDEGNATIL